MTPHSRLSGFTLLELLVTLTMMTILTAMVAPAWYRHMERGWRAEARSAMLGAMLELERHALATVSFAGEPGGAVVAGKWPLCRRRARGTGSTPAPARTLDWSAALSFAPCRRRRMRRAAH